MTARASVITLSLLALALPARAADPEAELHAAKPGDPLAVVIVGVEKAQLAALAGAKPTADEWLKVARLVVDEGTPAEVAKRQAVAGEWSVTADALRFEPQYPLAPG